MSLRSLRGRLVAASALAIVMVIAGFGLIVEVLIDHQLHRSLDQTLRSRASDVARLAASAPSLLTVPGALEAPLGGRQLSVEVLDSRGRIVARSPSLGGRVLPGGTLVGAALANAREGYLDSTLSGDTVRVYVAPLADTGGVASGGAVLVGSSTAEIEADLHRTRVLIALSAVGAALLGAMATALLTHRGLRPLRKLSAAASDVERTGDVSRRLPEPTTGDELGELAETLNGMLAALEAARERERRFLADASHELRTPLTSLRGNAAYIARHGADPEAIADIEADAARLANLLDDLLALEREGAEPDAPFEPVRLDELAAEVAGREARAHAGPLAAVTVRGERVALGRALSNLIENARLHGPPGGRITVELEQRGDRALLSVTDEGAGIGPDELEHAFRRFWRGGDAGQRPGSGLGLPIVAAIAARHGGTVSVAGSRFTIDLPALKDLSRTITNVDDAPMSERA